MGYRQPPRVDKALTDYSLSYWEGGREGDWIDVGYSEDGIADTVEDRPRRSGRTVGHAPHEIQRRWFHRKEKIPGIR